MGRTSALSRTTPNRRHHWSDSNGHGVLQVIIGLDDEYLIAFAEQAFRVGGPAQLPEVDCGDQARLMVDIDATAEFRSCSQFGFAAWQRIQSLCFSNPENIERGQSTNTFLAFGPFCRQGLRTGIEHNHVAAVRRLYFLEF